MKDKGTGAGFGKTILFGEHFVVYGLPGIASGIGDRTIAEIEPAEKYELIDNRPATPDYKQKKKGEMERSMKMILDFMRIDVEKNPVKITLSGNLYCTSGVGASAAMATSIARAFSDLYELNLNDEQINRISYEGEKGTVGTHSGLDNTCATFGGLIWFIKNLEGGENTIEHIDLKEPIDIVLANTGISQDTKEVVMDVKSNKEAEPEKYERIFRDYEAFVHEARSALEGGDFDRLAQLIDRNHELLREITVSCKEAEEIITAAKENGATAGKITGTGRGGYVILLTPRKDIQDRVAKAIEAKGYKTMKTTIGY
ncbi:MAG: mevalonate kinase [Candidatus Aenigmatarchaeota archaeon]|nr:MAG: mevalonate kinase [Candidatus Aenigmarchaeota archaeon]